MAQFSNHRRLAQSSQILAIGWLATISWYFAFAAAGMTWGYAAIVGVQLVAFLVIARGEVVLLPLIVMSFGSLVLHLLATAIGAGHWWSAFTLNRIFDLMLLYVASCALYRILRVRHKKKGAPLARPHSFDVFTPA